MTYSKDYRKNLKLYWQQFYPEYSIPEGYHVHHIKPKCLFNDKNDPRIHHPSNLIALHPDDHWTIHKLRGDKYIKESLILSINGRKASAETKEKISKAKMGENNPAYGKPSWNKGCKWSDESKLKMSISSKGISHPQTEETKQKIGKANRGKRHFDRPKMSDATKEIMRTITLGHSVSDKTRQKISKSLKGHTPGNTGKCGYNNGIITKFFVKGEQPTGWKLGKVKK